MWNCFGSTRTSRGWTYSLKIIAYTDGSCMPNPGNGGWAVVLIHKYMQNNEPFVYMRKLSGYVNNTTNNIMEFTSIKEALLAIKDKTSDVVIHSDSQYAINTLNGNWKKLKKNLDLIAEIKKIISEFKSVDFVWVRGHDGDKYNEVCDKLAAKTIKEKLIVNEVINEREIK